MNKIQKACAQAILVVILGMSCTTASTPGDTISPTTPVMEGSSPSGSVNIESEPVTSIPSLTAVVPVTGHLIAPAQDVPSPKRTVEDVESSGTGPEGRAPYGDSYAINRFERPFLQDMTYIPDLDIYRFSLAEDSDWYYVSIVLMGNNPNNSAGIDYGVEIDLDGDGFGDYMIRATPPYGASWDTSTVQVYQDTDHDSAGASASQSDAVFDGTGYETQIFDGQQSSNADPDLAWIRMVEGEQAVIQFAFKRSLVGAFFALGVVSDAGMKDVTQYDYADAFSEEDAGSPVSDKQFFPLASLYAVDNTCWEPYGYNPTGFKSRKTCQQIIQPANNTASDDEGDTPGEPPAACDPERCGGGPYDPVTCECL
jgi:hypothetical protein